MSASEQANAFCREVLVSGEVFMIEHETEGVLTFHLAGDQHARPVWSSRSRLVRMLEGPLAGPGRVIVRHAWREFVHHVLPRAERDGVLIGLNWAGPRARGYNLTPAGVLERVETARTVSRPLPETPSTGTSDKPDASDTTRRAG